VDELIDKRDVSVTPYVVLVAASMMTILMASLALYQLAEVDLGSNAGTLTTLASTIVGLGWFSYKIDRPMFVRERLWFASGVMLVNAILPATFVTIAVIVTGLPLNLQSVDDLFLGGNGHLFEAGILFVMTFTLLITFAQAYFFAWILTRKLPRKRFE
jgi:hypothetical protein